MLTALMTVIEFYASRTKQRHICTTQVNNPLESHILVLHCDIQYRDLRVSLPLCRCVRLRLQLMSVVGRLTIRSLRESAKDALFLRNRADIRAGWVKRGGCEIFTRPARFAPVHSWTVCLSYVQIAPNLFCLSLSLIISLFLLSLFQWLYNTEELVDQR